MANSKTVDRRDFLRIAGMAGLSVAFPVRVAKTAEPPKRFWIGILASGGWSTPYLLNPQPDSRFSMYTRSELTQIGAFLVPPYKGDPLTGQDKYGNPMGTRDPFTGAVDTKDYYNRFFTKHASSLMILNGMYASDPEIHNQERGPARAMGGRDDYPSLPALYAKCVNSGLPMSYISSSGYGDVGTRGLLQPARPSANPAQANALAQVANPAVADAATGARFALDTNAAAIKAQVDADLKADLTGDLLGMRASNRSALYATRTSPASLNSLVTTLRNGGNGINYGDWQCGRFIAQAEVTLAAMAAGLSCSASLAFQWDFDSHSPYEGDRKKYEKYAQTVGMDNLCRYLDYLFTRADDYGLGDQINFYVASEFSRRCIGSQGPEGSDHNARDTSMIFRGPDFPKNKLMGASVVDSTDRVRLRASPVNEVTMAPDPSGVILEPIFIHQAMRDLAGIKNHPEVMKYPLGASAQVALGKSYFPGAKELFKPGQEVPVLPIFKK